jgi:hypothetical protein
MINENKKQPLPNPQYTKKCSPVFFVKGSQHWDQPAIGSFNTKLS